MNTQLFTDRQERQICQEFLAGQTQRSLATKYSCCQGTVKNVIARNSVGGESKRLQGRRPRFTPQQKQQICDAYEKGKTQDELVDCFGCTQATVSHIVHARLSRATLREIQRRNKSRARAGCKSSEETCRRMSVSKKRLNLRGSRNPAWKGGRHYGAGGYMRVYAPDHPRARNGAVAEHRLVMEKHLGRYLQRNELVHHKNGVRDDNRLENLQIVTNSNHRGVVKCPHCNKRFQLK